MDLQNGDSLDPFDANDENNRYRVSIRNLSAIVGCGSCVRCSVVSDSKSKVTLTFIVFF